MSPVGIPAVVLLSNWVRFLRRAPDDAAGDDAAHGGTAGGFTDCFVQGSTAARKPTLAPGT